MRLSGASLYHNDFCHLSLILVIFSLSIASQSSSFCTSTYRVGLANRSFTNSVGWGVRPEAVMASSNLTGDAVARQILGIEFTLLKKWEKKLFA